MLSTLIILAALPSVAAERPTPAPLKQCAQPQPEQIEARHPIGMRKLGEIAPAKQLLGVYRSVDGCPNPIVVREEVGLPKR